MGRRSSRLEDQRFVIEGPSLVAEAVQSGWPIERIFVDEDAVDLAPEGATIVRSGVLAKVMDVATARPVVALAVRLSLAKPPEDATFIVVAHQVSDPGNLGTILRTAEAAGAHGVVVTPGTVDAFSPKVVRSSAGALFHIPVIECELDAIAFRLLGTSAAAGVAYDQANLVEPFALVLGNEAHGLGADTRVDGWLTISHVGRAESLNVAMAATVICFEAARQRR